MMVDVSDVGEASEEKAKPRNGTLVLGAGALALGASIAAGVYFLAPASVFVRNAGTAEQVDKGEAGAAQHAVAKNDHVAAKKEGKSDSHAKGAKDSAEADKAPRFQIVGDNGVFTPEPIVVSIRPTGRVRYLKLGFAVETSPESEAVFVENELRIRDVLNVYLRAVDVGALEDPLMMSQVRSQIARRVKLVVQPAPVRAVLITDFILS